MRKPNRKAPKVYATTVEVDCPYADPTKGHTTHTVPISLDYIDVLGVERDEPKSVTYPITFTCPVVHELVTIDVKIEQPAGHKFLGPSSIGTLGVPVS